jgi:hypothetical protein
MRGLLAELAVNLAVTHRVLPFVPFSSRFAA